MDLSTFDLTEDDRAVRDVARDLCRRRVAPLARETDELEAFPEAQMAALVEAGLAGILVPSELGGGGGTMLQYCLVMEEIAAACAATSTTFMTQVHGILPILIAGTSAQQRRWVTPAVEGAILTSIAITEPQAGSDLAGMTATALPTDDGYRLSGQKIFITNGNRADLMCVFARTDPDDRYGGISILAVELPAPGVTFGSPLKKMGIRGSDTAAVYFDDVKVTADALIGQAGQGFSVAMGALGDARISTAAQSVGVAARAYELASDYASERRQFGRPIGDFQAVQLTLMDMHMQVSAARALLHRVARFIDSGCRDEYSVEAAMAKVHCSDTAMRVTSAAIDVLGGYGYMREYEVERLMRDAKIMQIYDGTNAINRLNMARQLRRRVAGGSEQDG